MGEKFLNLAGLSLYDRNIKEWTQNEIKSAQADWNETNSESKSFIANKPFGEENGSFDFVCHPFASTSANFRPDTPDQDSGWVVDGTLPYLNTGDRYTVVFKGNTYENLEVVNRYGIYCLGNSGAAVRAVLAMQSGIPMDMLVEDKPNDMEFVLTMDNMGTDRKYWSMGCYVDHTFHSSEEVTLYLKDPDTGNDICSITASVTVTGPMGPSEYSSVIYAMDSEEFSYFNTPEEGVEQTFVLNNHSYTYNWMDIQGMLFLGDPGLVMGTVTSGPALLYGPLAPNTNLMVLIYFSDGTETEDEVTISFAYSRITKIQNKFLDVPKVATTGSFKDLKDSPISVNYSGKTSSSINYGWAFSTTKYWAAPSTTTTGVNVTSLYKARNGSLTFKLNDDFYTDLESTSMHTLSSIYYDGDDFIAPSSFSPDLINWRVELPETLYIPFNVEFREDNLNISALTPHYNPTGDNGHLVYLTGYLELEFNTVPTEASDFNWNYVDSVKLVDLHVLGNDGTHTIQIIDPSNNVLFNDTFVCEEDEGPFDIQAYGEKIRSSSNKGTWRNTRYNSSSISYLNVSDSGYVKDRSGSVSTNLWTGSSPDNTYIEFDDVEYQLEPYGETSSTIGNGICFGNSTYSDYATSQTDEPKYEDVPFLIIVDDSSRAKVLTKYTGVHKFSIYSKEEDGTRKYPEVHYTVKSVSSKGINSYETDSFVYSCTWIMEPGWYNTFDLNCLYRITLFGKKYEVYPYYLCNNGVYDVKDISNYDIVNFNGFPISPDSVLEHNEETGILTGYVLGDIGILYENWGLRFGEKEEQIDLVGEECPFCILISPTPSFSPNSNVGKYSCTVVVRGLEHGTTMGLVGGDLTKLPGIYIEKITEDDIDNIFLKEGIV